MASTTESSTNALTTSTNAETEDENEWVLPVWRSSTVLEGKADLTGVSFYPYGNKGEDPVFAVAGIGLIAVYRYMRENSGKDKVILLYEYRDKDDFKYVNNDDPQKEAKTSPNLGEKDEHQRSRAIAWARRDDYLPLLCVTGPGDIQPPKQPNPDSNVSKTFPPIAVNTLIRVINPYTGERIHTLLGHGKTINALATSPTIPYILASASDDKTFFLWSLAQKHTKAPCIAVIGGWGHIDRVLSLAWHPKGEWLLSGGFDNRVCLWNVSQSELDLPAYNQPCGEWVAKQVLMPYFVSSEVHRHPVERVAWKDDTIISHGMAERYITQWKITGFSSRTPTEMLPAKPSFQDEDARTRSAWDLTDRDKVQNPLYRRLLRFGVPEKKDEMLDDPWCEKRGFVDFDVYVPTKMRESEAGGKGGHTHATLAVCKGMEVRFWDFNRLLAWKRQFKKLNQGEILELRWQEMESGNAKDEPEKREVLAEEETAEVSRGETPPTQLARIDPDDSDSEVMLSIRQEISARKARSAEKARKKAEAASSNSTPTKAKPPMRKRTAVRKTAPSTDGVPSEPAGSAAKSESVRYSAMFRRESMVAKRKREEQERAEKKRLSSNKAVPDVSDGTHINGQKEAAATTDDEADAVLSFQLAQRPRRRKVRQSLTFKERVELKRGKENKRGDDVDKDKDGDNAMGLDGARSPKPAKMASRKTAPSTGGLRAEYGLGLDGGGDERLSSRQYGSMSLQSIHASRVARKYEPGGLGIDAQSAEATEGRQRGPALTAMAHNAYAVQSNSALPSSAANDEPPRGHGMMSLASIQASRTARVYYTVVPNRAVAAPSRGVPARKTAPSTGGVLTQEPLPINGADINVTILSDDEEKVYDEDPMALRDAEAALYAEPPVKRRSKKEIEAAEFAEIGLRPCWLSMRYDKDDNELEHIKQSVIVAQHQEEIDAINAEKTHWKKVREDRAAAAARAKEIRKRRARPRTQQGLRKITGDPVHRDAMDISSDEEDVKHIPGYTKFRLADIWQIGNYPPDFERMGKQWGYIMEKTYNDTSPILIVRTNEKGMVDDNGDFYAYAYDIGKRVRKWEEDSLFEVPLPRKRYKIFPIADLPAWQRFSFSPIFGCWIAPPRPEHNEPSTQVRQRVDSEGHMDSERAYFIKTRHRQRVYKVALQMKSGGEDMESDSEPEAPRPRYPPNLMMYGRTGEDLIKYMDSLENGELVNDKPAESSAAATAAPAPAPVPSQPRRPLPFAAQKKTDQYESDGQSISTSILPSGCQRGRKRPLEDEPWKTHVCPHCDRRFGRAEQLKRHYTTGHKQLKDFECQKCGKKFNRKNNRDEHARTCNGGWIVEGFGFLARQNERLDSDVEESEPIRSPVARLLHTMGFGMDGAGSGDDRGRATLRSGALPDDDDGAASMQESSSSRPPLLSSGLRGGRRVAPAEDDGSKPYVCEHCNDRFSRSEHLNRHERTIHSQEKPFKCQKCSRPFNRDDNLRQHMRVHGNGNNESEQGAVEEPSQDDVPSDKPTDPAPVKSKPLSGYNAMLQIKRDAQLRKRSLTDSLGDSDNSMTAKSKKPALRELRQDGSTQPLSTPPRRTSARRSLAREDSAAGDDTTEIGVMVQNSHPVYRAISGLSTREGGASTDSSRKSSRVKRQTSRRSELVIDMLDTAAVKAAKKVRCDSCGGALTGRGSGRYSFQVAGKTEDDPPREFCAPCHKRDFGDGKEKEKEKPKDRRTSITFEGDGAQVCCLCNSKSSPVWNQRLHHEERFGDGKFCCKPCYDNRYREKMNPGSTTGPKSRGRKRARELSPYTGPSDQVPEDITGSDADKAMKEVGLSSPDLPASSPVKSSSPSKDKGNAKEEPSKEKLRPEGWEKYHMGDAWRPLDAHHVDSVSVERVQAEMAEDRVARCCRWSLDGGLLVVVGDFGLVSVFERP